MYRVAGSLEPVPLNSYAPLALSRNVDDTTWERVLKLSLMRRKEKESARTVLRGAVVVVGGGVACLQGEDHRGFWNIPSGKRGAEGLISENL